MAKTLREAVYMRLDLVGARAAVQEALQHALQEAAPVKTGELARTLRVTIPMPISHASVAMKRQGQWRIHGTAPHNIPGAFGRPPPFGESGRFGGKFHPGEAPDDFVARALASPAMAELRRRLPSLLFRR